MRVVARHKCLQMKCLDIPPCKSCHDLCDPWLGRHFGHLSFSNRGQEKGIEEESETSSSWLGGVGLKPFQWKSEEGGGAYPRTWGGVP